MQKRRPSVIELFVLLAIGQSLAGCQDGTTGNKAAVSSGVEFHHDFRNKAFPDTRFKAAGPDAANRIKVESDGLRITLPAERDKPGPVGVAPRFAIKGDCEITVGYEIIQADQPTRGWGVGLEVYFQTNTPTKEAMAFHRMINPSGSHVYAFNRMTTNEQGKRIAHRLDDILAGGTSGQLRIVRAGAQAVLSASEQDSKEFRQLHDVALGTEDIVLLRLSAYPGNGPYAVDIRLRDLLIKGGSGVIADEANPSRSRAALSLVGGLFAVLLVVGGTWLWWRQRRTGNVGHGTP